MSIDRAGVIARALEFSQKHGVLTTIAFDGCPANTYIECDPVLPEDWPGILFFLDRMDAELAIYPLDFFSTIRLDYFVFGRELARAYADHDALGGAVVPYGDHRSVLFVSTIATDTCIPHVYKRVAHHEIAHAIDIGFAGAAEGGWWATMNPPGFAYGGVDFDGRDILDMTHPSAGLVTKYAGWDVAEDYAEVFTALHFAEKGDELHAWLESDPSLRAKFKAVVGALASKWKPLVESLPNYSAIPDATP